MSPLSIELPLEEYTDGEDISVAGEAQMEGEIISLSLNEVFIDRGKAMDPFDWDAALARKNEEE